MGAGRAQVGVDALLAALPVPAIVLSEKSLVSCNLPASALLEPLAEIDAEGLASFELLSRAFRGEAVASLQRLLADALSGRSGAVILAAGDMARRSGTTTAIETAARSSGWRVDAVAMLSSEGNPLALLHFGPDVRVAEALRASEERFRAVAEGGLDPFLILEAVRDVSGVIGDFRLVDLNRRAEHFLGASRSALLGKSLAALFPLEAPADYLARCANVVETRVSFETELGSGGEEWRANWTKIQVVALADGIALTCRDISDQRHMEEELRQSQKMEALGRLAGGVAHDFNNLLTVINGYSDLLLEEEALAASSLREEAKEIRQAGERAAILTRQLLAFGRQQVLSPTRLDLAEVVGAMQRMLQRLIGEDIELRTEIEPGVGCVMADRSQMEQIVVNLAVNARDAMPEGGQLRLGLGEVDACGSERRQGERLVRLSVSDSGCGMDESTRARIFEPFFTTKARGRGTGLGLSTVHGIVTQSGGRIEVESEPGRGASFSLYLPRVAGRASAQAVPERQVGQPQRRSGTVLLVEDEPQIRTLGRRVLEAAGFRVLLAENGVDALALLAREKSEIDVLVTDVVMPEMSGPKLVEQLRPLLPGLKVLFVSGYSRNELARTPRGVDVDFLSKPFRPGEVVRRVHGLLEVGPPASAPRDPH